jgi:hypothetical protein
MSPLEFWHTVCLQEAKQMLKAGNQPIEQLPMTSAKKIPASSAACSSGM